MIKFFTLSYMVFVATMIVAGGEKGIDSVTALAKHYRDSVHKHSTNERYHYFLSKAYIKPQEDFKKFFKI